jgi:hypothetical protein
MDMHLCRYMTPEPRPRRAAALWLVAALIGIVLGSASLAAAVASGPQELAGTHLAAQPRWIL